MILLSFIPMEWFWWASGISAGDVWRSKQSAYKGALNNIIAEIVQVCHENVYASQDIRCKPRRTPQARYLLPVLRISHAAQETPQRIAETILHIIYKWKRKFYSVLKKSYLVSRRNWQEGMEMISYHYNVRYIKLSMYIRTEDTVIKTPSKPLMNICLLYTSRCV